MTAVDTGAPVNALEKSPHTVQVTVNGDAVQLPQGKVTGLQVKQVAIAQGVEDIALDFQLSIKRGDRYVVVGDADEVEAHPGEEFLAVAPDDNS